MSRIESAFRARTGKGQKAFAAFLTAGDPSLAATEEFILTLAENGADVVEIGVPFSDPAADGPVIQRANLRGAASGTTIHGVFDMLARVRTRSEVALVFLLYANIVQSYGIPAFFAKCRETGVDGVIIADVPFEEEGEFAAAAEENGVDLIRLLAPTSRERTERIIRDAKGFLYCVSSLGVTGERGDVSAYLESMTAPLRGVCPIPTAIGFGIGTPEQAKEAAQYADGAIIGSAIVKLIEKHGANAAPHLADFAGAVRAALDA